MNKHGQEAWTAVSLTLAVSSLIRRFLTVIRLLESKFWPGMSMSSAYLSSSSSSLSCSHSCRQIQRFRDFNVSPLARRLSFISMRSITFTDVTEHLQFGPVFQRPTHPEASVPSTSFWPERQKQIDNTIKINVLITVLNMIVPSRMICVAVPAIEHWFWLHLSLGRVC